MSNRQDTMQRIQVGVMGLAAVLLLVSIANFVMQRASNDESALEAIQAETSGSLRGVSEDAANKPSEPLAELGITPTSKPEEEEVKGGAGSAARKKPAVEGQVVPDLKPDPKLEAPMDREQQ